MAEDQVPDLGAIGGPSKQSLSPDQFVHEAVIGHTATTVVHRVSTVATTEQIAVKHPAQHGTVTGDIIKSFQNEAQQWARLSTHENIVGVVDWDESPLPWLHHDADLPWIAMEYMDGGDLSEYAGSLPVEASLWTAERLADAVWHAHHDGGGVIHHDLKPANILFRETPDEHWNVPKIGDWELARSLVDHSDSIGITTPQYTAPEQARNDTTDQQTDQFQLGIVLYELFTGHYPFVDDPASTPEAALIHGILENEPVPPTEQRSDLPEPLNDILLSSLAKDPTDRYEAVLQLRNAIARIRSELGGESRSRDSTTRRNLSQVSTPTAQTDNEQAVPSASEAAKMTPRTDDENPSRGIGLITQLLETDRGIVKTALADDGSFALSGLDSALSPGDLVVLEYEGSDPSAADVTSVRPAADCPWVDADDSTDLVDIDELTGEDKRDTYDLGIVRQMTETGRGTIDTHLADDGSFALCDLDTEIDVGDPVLLKYEDPNPSAADIKSVRPVPEAKQIFDFESGEHPSQE